MIILNQKLKSQNLKKSLNHQ